MKTVKIILLTAIAVLSVYSCSTDRDEDVAKIQDNAKSIDLSKLKTNKKPGDTSKIADSMEVRALEASGPLNPKDDDTGQEPIVDPTKPDKPW